MFKNENVQNHFHRRLKIPLRPSTRCIVIVRESSSLFQHSVLRPHENLPAMKIPSLLDSMNFSIIFTKRRWNTSPRNFISTEMGIMQRYWKQMKVRLLSVITLIIFRSFSDVNNITYHSCCLIFSRYLSSTRLILCQKSSLPMKIDRYLIQRLLQLIYNCNWSISFKLINSISDYCLLQHPRKLSEGYVLDTLRECTKSNQRFLLGTRQAHKTKMKRSCKPRR